MHMPLPSLLFLLFWGGWGVSWVLAAFWASPAATRATTPDVWVYRLLTTGGSALLYLGSPRRHVSASLWHVGYDGATVLALLTLPCFAFAWWARLYLGRLWSGSVTRKADHRLIDGGPYALVRHPIYTGLLGACLVTATAEGTFLGVASFIAFAAGFWLKARLEERFLVAELGADVYGEYCSRVPMLLPIRIGMRPRAQEK